MCGEWVNGSRVELDWIIQRYRRMSEAANRSVGTNIDWQAAAWFQDDSLVVSGPRPRRERRDAIRRKSSQDELRMSNSLYERIFS